ncbi:Ger(x)C family spore germination protein [Paenibacillus tarimensis]
MNRRKRKFYILLPALALTVLVSSGCWDRREIVDVALVMLTAVDKGNEPGTYRVHAHIADPIQLGGAEQPTAAGTAEEPVAHIETEGRNIDELKFKAERMLPRDIETSHRRVIVIGDPLAREGIEDILDQISRSPKNRLSTLLIVAENTEARALIEQEISIETFGMEFFRELVLRKAHVTASLKDFFINSTTPGQQPVAVSFAKTKANKVSVSGVAIFKDNKLKGYIKGTEVTALVSTLGGRPTGSVTFDAPQGKGDLSAYIYKLKVSPKVEMSQGEPVFTFNVRAYGRIMDNRTSLDLSNPEIIRKLEQSFTAEIERNYRTMFNRLQKKLRVDSIGLGSMIYRKYPKYWKSIEKDWPDLYPNQKVNWNVRGKITSVGAVGPSLFIPGEEVSK